MRLVELVDRLLEQMEADERLVFTLDGQLSTVDDYLEIRPEAEERIRALVEAGRLAIGPWQILMDEFLVSGESMLRNLELARRRAAQLGGMMSVGYLPDMFGHAAQMPQILRGAGLEHAVVWRGVPAAVDRHAFLWEAPDGSAVRAEYLPSGYGNAAHVLDLPERLRAKLELLRELARPFFGDDPVLAMYGTDHTEPAADLAARLDGVDGIRLDTLVGYLDGARADGLRAIRGELRSSARANLLMGVTSARIDLKAACTRTERLLERYAEPLHALHGEGRPEPFLDLAWRRVIENSAHDSICGCSVDAVCDQVLVRFAEAAQIAEAVVERAAARVAREAPRGAAAVLNPSPLGRTDLVELDLAVPADWGEVTLALPDGATVPTQELARRGGLLASDERPGAQVPDVFRRLHGRELFGRWWNGYELEQLRGRRRLTLDVGDEQDPAWLDVDELRREISLAAAAAAGEIWEVRIRAAARRTLLASVPAPALGWTSVVPVAGTGPVEHAVTAGPGRLGNGLVDVFLAADGTFTLRGEGAEPTGVGRLVDAGDFGDTYNYAPPGDDLLVDEPESVEVELVEPGPLRGVLSVVRTFRWPLEALPDGSGRSLSTAAVAVRTDLELRAGEPFVRIAVSFENPCSDHRLRFHVPLARAATTSAAEGQFAVVERGLEPEGGYGEVALPTHPARGFVDAGGVAVLLDHVLEYELVDGRELALTLLRSTGLISRNDNPYRDDPAGPEIAVPAAQCRRPWSVRFALFPHPGAWHEDGVLDVMERYQHPFVVAPGTGERERAPASREGIRVEGEGIVLSSLRQRESELELRLVCQSPEPRTARIEGDFARAEGADLLGEPTGLLETRPGSLELELRPWEIRTVRLLSSA